MAIEASNLTEKDELIAKFYTIRAGLSVIAEESEKIRSLEDEINDLKRKDENYKKKACETVEREKWNLEYKLQEANKTFETLQRGLNYQKDQRNILVKNGSKKYKPYLRWDIITILCIVGSIILLVIGIVSDAPTFFEFSIAAYIPLVIILCKIWQRKKGNEKWYEEIDRQDEMINNIESDMNKTKSEVEKYRKAINEINNNKLPSIRNESPNGSQISLLESKYSTTVAVCTDKAKSIRNALIKEFGNILTEDDWGNVDLLIFYLNTGRADSLKEALQLVDRQRQTNQIVQAIGTAASYISNTMQANTYKLARVMDNCFSNLSNQISTNHQQLIGAMNNISDSFNSRIGSFESTVKTQSQALLDSQALNASLLKEANRRSDELMNELRYNQKYWVK